MQLNRNIIIMFIIIFSSSFFNIYSQEIEMKKKSIDSLFMLVKEITPNEKGEWLTKKLSVKDSDLEKAKRLLYDAYAYNQIEYDKKLVEWVKDWENTEIKKAKKDRGVSPGVRIQKLKEALAEKYGWDYVNFLETPYFLKIKVIDKSLGSFKVEEKLHLPEVDLRVEVLDVIKGKKFYSKGQIIIIGYLPIWFRDCNCKVDFEINRTYALPLRHWQFYNKKDSLLALKLNGMHTIYKIDNNIVSTPFEIEKSPNKNWDEFKNEFINKFLIEN